MVAQKYRWDFIGLSTDTKPTAETSEKVVNGSTYYCSDTSKLYVYCDGTWYERQPLGGGGGGGDTVYSSKTTSNSATGGAVYVGNLGTDQAEIADPTETDNHYRYFWSLPANNTNLPKNNTINILGEIKGNAGQNYSNTIIGAGSIGESGNNQCTNNIILSCGSFDNRSKVGSSGRATNSVMVGAASTIPQGGGSVVVGNYSSVNCNSLEYGNVGVGTHISIGSSIQSSIALGAYTKATRSGELSIGLSTGNNVGYNNTRYRVIGGVHDGQELHDAATVAQGNTLATTAPTTSTVGVLGQLYTDTTNMHTYQCTAISGNTYTWTQRW